MTLHLCTGYRNASGKLADAGISSVMMTMTPFVKSPDVRLRTGNRQMLKSSDLNSRKRRKRRIAWDFQKPVTGRKAHTHASLLHYFLHKFCTDSLPLLSSTTVSSTRSPPKSTKAEKPESNRDLSKPENSEIRMKQKKSPQAEKASNSRNANL
jgi:hypothetical protein